MEQWGFKAVVWTTTTSLLQKGRQKATKPRLPIAEKHAVLNGNSVHPGRVAGKTVQAVCRFFGRTRPNFNRFCSITQVMGLPRQKLSLP